MKKILLTLLFVNFLTANAQNPVQEFNFNGNLNSADNTISFLGTPVFVNDRMGSPKSALRLTNKAYQAVIGELPQDNKPKTISVWVKFNAINIPNYILGYGAAVNGQYFGLVQQPVSGSNSDLSLVGWGDANNVIVSVPLVKETWYMYSITYDGNVSKIYRNGELLKSVEGIKRSAKGYILNLGKLNTSTSINTDIDDLRLYTVAMTDEQVREAFNSSKVNDVTVAETAVSNSSTLNTSKKTAAVPAKTSASADNTIETNKTGKRIEVFSQGRQIMRANASNITDLPEGTYLIKVINSNKK
ncbi:MAG: LamG-like jellyroll fold domain-containing protein [Flavobacterium nitrogenifigens]|uniref:LamG-like jellyroll fold domain-containing protein n=1 Tax=Flavobacterium nitrogenifigens TaxID=1617283 RepID=UPI0028097BBB|nr:LamG-like jellyroll fold domain-containing protein [Flavobacterium nitrogenifigens]MDQ8013091.1 LamG-like jellyroll fold domain-containing protein [Flavobacterium nitrogenifigens]